MSRGQTAMRERLRKEARPEEYCSARGCLWNVSRSPCRNHDRAAGASGDDRVRALLAEYAAEPLGVEPPLTFEAWLRSRGSFDAAGTAYRALVLQAGR